MSEDRIPYNPASESLKADVAALEKAIDVLLARGFHTTAGDLADVIEAIDPGWSDRREGVEALDEAVAVLRSTGASGTSHRDALLDILRRLRESTGRHWRIELEDGTRIEV